MLGNKKSKLCGDGFDCVIEDEDGGRQYRQMGRYNVEKHRSKMLIGITSHYPCLSHQPPTPFSIEKPTVG